MEKNTDVGMRTENLEAPLVVKSLQKDVLVSDILDIPTKDDGDVLVLVGAEITDKKNELTKKPREGSGLVSIPTILEEELQQLLAENAVLEKKDGLDETMKNDRSMDDKAVLAGKVEEAEYTKQKTEKENGFDVEAKETIEEGGDGGKMEKKDVKEKRGKTEKDKKEKKEKDKEKREKKSKKSDVERIQKKLEKVHAKIERILAKKEEYLQRLAEAQEKEQQEKQRLAMEETAKQERESSTATKSSVESSGDALLEGETRHGQEVGVKQVELPVQSSVKQLDEIVSTPNTDTPSNPDEKHSDEKVVTDHSEKFEGVKDT